MQEVRLRAVPPAPEQQPYIHQLVVELVETDHVLDGRREQPELVGNITVRLKGIIKRSIEIEVARIDEAWTGPVEVTVL